MLHAEATRSYTEAWWPESAHKQYTLTLIKDLFPSHQHSEALSQVKAKNTLKRHQQLREKTLKRYWTFKTELILMAFFRQDLLQKERVLITLNLLYGQRHYIAYINKSACKKKHVRTHNNLLKSPTTHTQALANSSFILSLTCVIYDNCDKLFLLENNNTFLVNHIVKEFLEINRIVVVLKKTLIVVKVAFVISWL